MYYRQHQFFYILLVSCALREKRHLLMIQHLEISMMTHYVHYNYKTKNRFLNWEAVL